MKVGQQYLLVLPPSLQGICHGWHLAVVTLVEIFINQCPDPDGPHAVCDCEGCRMAPYIFWVTSPGLVSNYPRNVLRARSEWLQDLNAKTPCDCPLKSVLSQGCQNQDHD